MKEKEDLQVKIVSKEEAFWTDIKDKTEHEVGYLEKMLKFNNAILELALMKIAQEKGVSVPNKPISKAH